MFCLNNVYPQNNGHVGFFSNSLLKFQLFIKGTIAPTATPPDSKCPHLVLVLDTTLCWIYCVCGNYQHSCL